MDKELSWSTFIMTLFYAFGLKSLVIFILNMECHAHNISLGLTFPSCLCMSAAASRPLGDSGGNRPLSFIKPDEVGHDVVAGEYSLLCEVEPSVVDSHLPRPYMGLSLT